MQYASYALHTHIYILSKFIKLFIFIYTICIFIYIYIYIYTPTHTCPHVHLHTNINVVFSFNMFMLLSSIDGLFTLMNFCAIKTSMMTDKLQSPTYASLFFGYLFSKKPAVDTNSVTFQST